MHNTLRLPQPTALLQPMPRLHAIPDMAGRAMATAQDPTSCAKLSERARLATVAPTLSPMPNGKPEPTSIQNDSSLLRPNQVGPMDLPIRSVAG